MNKKVKILLVINFLVILFLIISEVFFNDDLTNIDLLVSNFIFGFRTDILTKIMKVITFFGSTEFVIGVLVVYFIVKKSLILPVCAAFNALINSVLKMIFHRERPVNILVHEETFSFPSGHSSISVCLYGFFIYELYKSKIKYKYLYISLFVLLILLIGFSRIYLGAHYLSDVVTGYLFSLEYLLLFISLFKKYELIK